MRKCDFDYPDLNLTHRPRPKADLIVEIFYAFAVLRKEGRVRSIGVSSFRVQHVENLAASPTTTPVVIQFELCPYFQKAELRKHHLGSNIQTETWSPIGHGGALAEPLLVKMDLRESNQSARVAVLWHLDLGNIAIPMSVHSDRMAGNIDAFAFALSRDRISSIRDPDTGRRFGAKPSSIEGLQI